MFKKEARSKKSWNYLHHFYIFLHCHLFFSYKSFSVDFYFCDKFKIYIIETGLQNFKTSRYVKLEEKSGILRIYKKLKQNEVKGI